MGNARVSIGWIGETRAFFGSDDSGSWIFCAEPAPPPLSSIVYRSANYRLGGASLYVSNMCLGGRGQWLVRFSTDGCVKLERMHVLILQRRNLMTESAHAASPPWR